MKQNWQERAAGLLLILLGYALPAHVLAAVELKGAPPDWSAVWLFAEYGAGTVLMVVGAALFLVKKHPPFEPWVRIAAVVAVWNEVVVTVAEPGMRFPVTAGSLIGWQRLEGVLALAVFPAVGYLLLAGERTARPGWRKIDRRIIGIRFCGAVILAWPAAHALLSILAATWNGGGALNVELFVLQSVAVLLSAVLGAELLFGRHESFYRAYWREHAGVELPPRPFAAMAGKLVRSGWYNGSFFVVCGLFTVFAWMIDKDSRMGGEVFADFDERIAGQAGGARIPWEPVFNAPVQKAIVGAYEIVMYPGAAASYGILRLSGGGPGILDLSRNGGLVMMVSWSVLSWLFWDMAFKRFAFWMGLYDPFKADRIGRLLRPVSRAMEWWAAFRLFGRTASAAWAGLIEVVAHPWRRGDIFLGRPKLPIGGMLRPVGVETEKHMLTVAETGSGKSTAGLIVNLCIYEGSVLCIDPKGELAEITYRRRGPGGKGVQGMGQDVQILDPYELVVEHGSSYNPFDEMAAVTAENPDRAVAFAEKIGEAVVKPMGGVNSEYWDKAARTLIRGLVLYIFVHEPPRNRTLLRLRELLMEGDRERYEEALEHDYIDERKTSSFEFLLLLMKSKRDGPYGHAIAGAASSVLDMGESQYGGVKTTAQEHTTFLDFPEIRRVCGGSTFRLADLKRTRMSVYVCLPVAAIAGAQGRWLRMFVVLFTDIVQASPEKPDPPVLLAIDEFPNIGRLDGIEIVAPLLRSYGVRFWGVAQDLDRLSHVYPECWSGFVGNAEAVQFMSSKEYKTISFISEKLGQHVVGSRAAGWGTAWLLDEEQVGRFLAPHKKNQIVWYGSRLPMRLKLAPYYEYLPYWYYEPDGRYREKWNRRLWRELIG